MEIAVPRSTLGLVDQLDLVVGWLYEGSGFESTYAVTPAGAIVDGTYDPDYAQHWRFDLTSPSAPTSYGPLP